MSVQRKDSQYTDAKGNLHKIFADGRTEIYYKGPHDLEITDCSGYKFMEITDSADESVNRRRFMPQVKQTVEETLQVRAGSFSQDAIPGSDSLEDDKEVAHDGNTT